MRYLRSWLFDIGILLVAIGVFAANGQISHSESKSTGLAAVSGGISSTGFIGILLVALGVIVMLVGTVRVRRSAAKS